MRYRRRFNQRPVYVNRDAPPKQLNSNRAGHCYGCGCAFAIGDPILWEPSTGITYAMECEAKCGLGRLETIAQAERDREAALADEEANETMHAM